MMKKLLIAGSGIFFTTSLLAQLPVSTSPTNKNVVLEELTGIHCGYCPDGHAIANSISANNPGRVVLVNIHAGSYAAPNAGEPDLRTTHGTALDNFFDPTGYPAGSVQRKFDGTRIAVGRGSWTSMANTVLSQASPVNIAMEASIDAATRVVTVTTQVYYTAPFAAGTNHYLNVGILQNNFEAVQTNYGNYNPSAILPNGKYLHQHIFRGFINANGTSGELVDASLGTVQTYTHTYTLPAAINGTDLSIGDLKFFAFVGPGMGSNATADLLTGTEVTPTYTNVPAATGNLNSIVGTYNVCPTEMIDPVVKVVNSGEEITSLDFSYSINGGTAATYTWTGMIPDFGNMEITLPGIAFTPQGTNTMNVTITSVNGGAGNVGATSTQAKPITIASAGSDNNVTVKMTTDRYGDELTWKIFNSGGTMVASGGPYALQSANGTYPQPDVILNLPNNDCYKAVVYDTYGDGFDSGAGNGKFEVLSGSTQVALVNTFSGSIADDKMVINGVVGINTLANEIGLSVYPNPTSSILNIDFTANNSDYTIEILDLTGRKLSTTDYTQLNGNQNLQISVADLNSGNYIVRISTNGMTSTQKLTVQ